VGGVNPNDEIRDAILRHLYEVHQKAKSPKSAGISIRDLQKDLKVSTGYKQQQVASNLDYLIQKEWAIEVIEPRSFTTKAGTTQRSEKRTYKISDTGIDNLEAASTFQRSGAPVGVNITNVQGVTIVGDGNVVNTNYTDLSRVLSEMKTAILAADAVSDPEKLNVAADIDALQSQLQKPDPEPSVVRALWSGVQTSVTAAGFVDLVEKATHLLKPLLG
jgi:hypothetical protein